MDLHLFNSRNNVILKRGCTHTQLDFALENQLVPVGGSLKKCLDPNRHSFLPSRDAAGPADLLLHFVCIIEVEIDADLVYLQIRV